MTSSQLTPAAVPPAHPGFDAAAMLSAAGLKSTAPRRAALEALSLGGHRDAGEVFETMKQQLPGTSLQAVYGVLGALTDAGLIRKIAPDTGPALYEARIGDNHHHLVCRTCHRIVDIDCVIGAAPCLTPSDTAGFVVEQAEVIFRGVCSDCTAAEAPPTAAPLSL